jgi:hypothetical protein
MKRIIRFLSLVLSLALVTLSCSKDEDIPETIVAQEGSPVADETTGPETGQSGGDENSGGDTSSDTGDTPTDCNSSSYVFNEVNGIIKAEFEENQFADPWNVSTEQAGYSGTGYAYWAGSQYLSSPGNGLISFKLNITTPGTYQFVWHSAVVIGSSGTDHNDSWLRFPDADDFFAVKGTSIVYPKGSGKTPNPAGAGADGWFKVYKSGTVSSFKWQSSTYDNNAHNIFVTFNSPGEYIMEVSARSSGHAIDKFVLFTEDYSLSEITGDSTQFSEITCQN